MSEPAPHSDDVSTPARQEGVAEGYLRNRADPIGAAARAARWAAENAEAIRTYNSFVETHGVVGDDLRSW